MKRDDKFIQKLKLAMLEKGFNQVSLAKKIGIKSNSISQWLTGKNNPKLTTLEKVAKATGKPVNYFFSDESTSQNIIGNHNAQTVEQKDNDFKKEIELLKAKLEVQAITIENLKLRLEQLERER